MSGISSSESQTSLLGHDSEPLDTQQHDSSPHADANVVTTGFLHVDLFKMALLSSRLGLGLRIEDSVNLLNHVERKVLNTDTLNSP